MLRHPLLIDALHSNVKSGVSPSKYQWTKELQQLLRSTSWAPLPRLLLQLREMLRKHWCSSGRITSTTASAPCLGLGWRHQGAHKRHVRMHARDSSLTSKDLPKTRLQQSSLLWLIALYPGCGDDTAELAVGSCGRVVGTEVEMHSLRGKRQLQNKTLPRKVSEGVSRCFCRHQQTP